MNPVAVATEAARAGWRGTDLVTAVAIALVTSGGNEAKAGGLWGQAGAPADAAGQARSAYAKWKASGFAAFPAYANNAYLLMLPMATAAVASADVAGVIRDPAAAAGAVVGSITEAAGNLPGADVLGTAQSGLALAYKAGAWLSDRNNWVRIAQVVVGANLVIAGLIMIALPAAGSTAGGAVGYLIKKGGAK